MSYYIPIDAKLSADFRNVYFYTFILSISRVTAIFLSILSPFWPILQFSIHLTTWDHCNSRSIQNKGIKVSISKVWYFILILCECSFVSPLSLNDTWLWRIRFLLKSVLSLFALWFAEVTQVGRNIISPINCQKMENLLILRYGSPVQLWTLLK